MSEITYLFTFQRTSFFLFRHVVMIHIVTDLWWSGRCWWFWRF